jgi:multiple antibiotic resistance protein
MLETFIQTFFLYFIVIDPLGTTPLFLIVTQHMETKQKIKTAFSATTIAAIILLFFALVGSSLLNYLNISFPAFTIAGGIILFLISMEMLFDKRQQRKEEDLTHNSENVSIFPLATPLIAGPAGITSVIVSVSDIGNNFTNQFVGMLSLIVVLFLTFAIFFVASKSSQLINKKIINVFSRVIAIILAGLSVQYILDGIKVFLT